MTPTSNKPLDLLAEASRQLTVCAACRYCEGYCAVFPALARRTTLGSGDIDYLANICHDCRACYQACMYTAPHEFDLNIPAALSAVRKDSYARYTRPRVLAVAFSAPLAFNLVAFGLGLLLTVCIVLVTSGLAALGYAQGGVGSGSFYKVIPYTFMAGSSLVLSALVVLAWWSVFTSFWKASGGELRSLVAPSTWARALVEGLTLRWMQGGEAGCYYPDENRPSGVRRRLHMSLVIGLGLTFAATVAAFVLQDLFGLLPPYPLLSVPVVAGTFGGLAVVGSATGLLVLKRKRPVSLGHSDVMVLDVAFLLALDIASISGLLLLALRETSLMGPLLVIHLGSLFVLYVTTPYGKLVHALYRVAALLRNVAERRPPTLGAAGGS